MNTILPGFLADPNYDPFLDSHNDEADVQSGKALQKMAVMEEETEAEEDDTENYHNQHLQLHAQRGLVTVGGRHHLHLQKMRVYRE